MVFEGSEHTYKRSPGACRPLWETVNFEDNPRMEIYRRKLGFRETPYSYEVSEKCDN